MGAYFALVAKEHVTPPPRFMHCVILVYHFVTRSPQF